VPGIARVAVVGTGSWGTTLAVMLARNGHDTVLLCRSEPEARRLETDGENRRFRPGLRFPAGLHVDSHPDRLRDAEVVVLAVPAASVSANAALVRPHLASTATVVSATKGIEPETGALVSDLLVAAGMAPAQVCALSGPNFSAEIAAGLPAATVIAGTDRERVRAAQALFMSDNFRVYASDDLAGVQMGGALKNVVAIACGISDGLGSGQNAKAALMTRALAEITRLGIACGARAMTFLGLAGIGDLIATCESDLSRNRRLGLAIAQGRGLDEALAGIDGVVEGVGTARAARVLARRHGVEMPIAEELCAVLFEGKDPARSLLDLMRRPPKQEFPESG
jgi:glycerol-3-phosphate dehydrogenase (NAD(P)+)